MLTTRDISRYMRNHGSHYLGTFPLDRLPNLRGVDDEPFCLIVNTDVSSLPGMHWIAVYVNPKLKRAEVFDSYGRPPPFQLQKWLTRQKLSWSFNRRLLQGPLSTLCGGYCVFFLGKRCTLPASMQDIVRREFSPRFADNDAMIRRFMLAHFQKRM